MEILGIRADKADKSRNIAAVMVTANIGPFAKNGSRMDVTVSSMEMQIHYRGYTLQTALQGADREVYAVAQGPVVSVGGLSAFYTWRYECSKLTILQESYPMSALVEQEIESQVLSNGSIDLLLLAPLIQ